MSREWKFRFEDILAAAKRALAYTQGMWTPKPLPKISAPWTL